MNKDMYTHPLGYDSRIYSSAALANMSNHATAAIKNILADIPVYVAVHGYDPREGTIARLEMNLDDCIYPIYKTEIEFNAKKGTGAFATYMSRITFDQYIHSYLYSYITTWFKLCFDDNTVVKNLPYECSFSWMPNYTGPTKKVYDRSKIVKQKKEAKAAITDIFGHIPEIDDVVTLTVDNELWFGTVCSKNSDGSRVEVNVYSKSTSSRKKTFVARSDKLMVINDALRDNILIYKLSN